MGKFIQDFKAFAMKGNVVDMAVGVIIGGAFGKIVSSLVNDIIMPVVAIATGGVNFTDKTIILRQAVKEGTEVISPEVVLTYGVFIQSVVDFLIIAFSIFVAIRFMSKLKKAEEAPAPAPEPPAPSKEELLLTEIRDLLAKEVKEKTKD